MPINAFHVSVIIPVYNAAGFLKKAVESAVILEEVGEVILIEDGSPDDALEVCKELEDKYQKIKLYQHPNGENKGAGASRNLGIKKAIFDFIAFLDADDWYLPNRFKKDMEIFSRYPDADGVYGATGIYYEEKGFLDKNNLTTFNKELPPDQLAYNLFTGNEGWFTTDVVTLKKRFVNKVGFFDEDLSLHQDSLYWIICAVLGKLYPSELGKAIAIRRIHVNNRISKKNIESRKLYYQKLFLSLCHINGSNKKLFRIVCFYHFSKRANNLLGKLSFAMQELVKRPKILFKLI